MREEVPLAEQFRAHFRGYGHLYGALLDVLADDLDAGGVTAGICHGHLDASRADVIHLRLLASPEQVPGWLDGLPAAKMFIPWSPWRLNLIGTACPALTTLQIGGLSTGEKNPLKL